MDKFQRNYRLFVDNPSGGKIEIDPPFTLEFDITRNILSSANTATFRIINLGKATRNIIYKDRYATAEYKGVELQAGYGDTMPTIFKGNIKQAYSTRQGTTQVTTIEAYDGGFALVNGEISKSYNKGTLTQDVLEDVLKSLPNVSRGTISPISGTLGRGNAITGNAGDLAKTLSGGGFFIDLERAHALGDDDCIEGALEIIDSSSGLLATPQREETILSFEMLFEPRLLIGQKIRLQSITENNFSGDYKIISLHHHGMISESVCGDCRTSVGLWYGTQLLKVLK